MSDVALLRHKLAQSSRRARVRTYCGQPIAPIVGRLCVECGDPVAALQSAGVPAHSRAGQKKLAFLRSMICAVDPRGHAVLCALYGPDAGARLADSSIAIPARMADALIEVMANLPMAIVPDGDAA